MQTKTQAAVAVNPAFHPAQPVEGLAGLLGGQVAGILAGMAENLRLIEVNTRIMSQHAILAAHVAAEVAGESAAGEVEDT